MNRSKKKIFSLATFMIYFIGSFLSIFTPQVVLANDLPLKLTINSSETEIQSGRFVDFNIKYEVLNYKQIKEGDNLVIEIPDGLTNVTPVYSKQHFKSAEKTGNTVTLTFGANASTALAGYIGLGAMTVNDTTKTKDATVKVKYGEIEAQCKIDVLPLSTGGTGGSGKETRSIVKFTPRQSENYVQDSASSGIMYPGCKELEFYLEVNPKLGELNNAVIKDVLPYEMELVEDSVKIKVEKDGSYTEVPENTFPIVTNKNYLQINFGDIKDDYRVFYKVKVLRDDLKISNSAKIEYEENGEKKVEMQDFYLKPYNYAGAVNGYKAVDKSVISNKSEDQTVIYTLVFENDNVFSKDEINLKDKLDKRIKFVDAIASDEFAVTYDPVTNTVSVKNSNGKIPAGMRKEVKIITDFSQVKPGETVTNTAGANTTVTKKKYDVRFKKTDSITGKPLPGAVFKVLDDKDNEIISNIVTDENGEGTVELTSEGSYFLKEVKAPDNYVLSDTKVPFTIDINSEGKTIELPNVTNEPQFSQIKVKKVDESNPSKVLQGAEFQLINKSDNTTYNKVTDINGIAQFANLKTGTYVMKEVKAPEGYDLSQEEQEVVITGEQKLIEITKSNKPKAIPWTPIVPAEKLGNLVVKYFEQGTDKVLAPQVTTSQAIGLEYITTSAAIDGYALVSTPSNATGKYVDGTVEVIYYYKKTTPWTPIQPAEKLGDLVVKYLEHGTDKVLVPGITDKQKVGTDYTTTAASIDGYDLIAKPTNGNGKYIDGTTEVIYYYAKKKVTPPNGGGGSGSSSGGGGSIIKKGDLVVKYLDRNTKQELASKITDSQLVGTAYTTAAKDISGYQLMNIPTNEKGKYIDGTTEVIYYYAKKIVIPNEKVPEGKPEIKEGVLVIKYLDKDTKKELSSQITDKKLVGTEYVATVKVIDGYELVAVPSNEKGKYIDGTTEVVYYYAQKKVIVPKEKIAEGAPLLPKTGEDSSVTYYVLGTLILILGLRINSRKSKKI